MRLSRFRSTLNRYRLRWIRWRVFVRVGPMLGLRATRCPVVTCLTLPGTTSTGPKWTVVVRCRSAARSRTNGKWVTSRRVSLRRILFLMKPCSCSRCHISHSRVGVRWRIGRMASAFCMCRRRARQEHTRLPHGGLVKSPTTSWSLPSTAVAVSAARLPARSRAGFRRCCPRRLASRS